jgi:1,4-dihydroxy-2-naphthoate octaprenyltransferase
MNNLNIAMWGKALRVIPRISKPEWVQLDIISRWLIATRSAVFIMTAFSAAIGGILAYYSPSFRWDLFIASFFGLILAHAANNLLNDLIDHNKGIDSGNYYRSLYGPQPIEHGLLTKKQMYRYIGVTLALALAIGSYLVFETGLLTLVLLVAGLFFVLFYTWPLKYIGLGEPSVIIIWGPLMVGGTYYVSTGGMWSWEVAVIGLVYALGPTTVLFGKHIDKIIDDRKKKVYTLPVILGEKTARFATIGMWVAQYLMVAWLVYIGFVSPLMFIVLLAIPKLIWAIKVFAKPRPTEEPETLDKGVWPLYLSAHAFIYNRLFGALFFLGLIIDLVLHMAGVTFMDIQF